jgi:hypothetical protein
MAEILDRIASYGWWLILITLCWIGAEWLCEGAVHTSKIDGCVAVILAQYVSSKKYERRADNG